MFVKLLLCGWFLFALYAQRDLALADQGDFSRATRLFTTTPLGFSKAIPELESEEYWRRFYTVWHREWELEWRLAVPATASIFLWIPGVVANILFYSTKVLSLPIVLALPKLLLLIMLYFMLFRLERERYAFVLCATLALPVFLMLTSTDYVVYFNSFYQEGPTLVFLVAALVSILWVKARPTWWRVIASIVITFLLGATKPGNLYWVPVFVALAGRFSDAGRGRRRALVVTLSALIGCLLTAGMLFLIMMGSKNAGKVNPYHCLFMGVLQTSENSAQRLQDIGFDRADTTSIGLSAFSVQGNPTFLKYSDRISYRQIAIVTIQEPAALARLILHAFVQMQDVSLEYLGHYAMDDPRRFQEDLDRAWTSSRQRQWNTDVGPSLFNLWCSLKYHHFPAGVWLLVSLLLFAGWFAYSLTKDGIHQDLALIGVLTSVGCAVNTVVAAVGDGTHELIKHLFLSNVLFDFAAIAFLASVALSVVEKVQRGHVNDRSAPN